MARSLFLSSSGTGELRAIVSEEFHLSCLSPSSGGQLLSTPPPSLGANEWMGPSGIGTKGEKNMDEGGGEGRMEKFWAGPNLSRSPGLPENLCGGVCCSADSGLG